MEGEIGFYDPKHWAWAFSMLATGDDMVGPTSVGRVADGRQEVTFLLGAHSRWLAAPLMLRSVEVGAVVHAEPYEPTDGIRLTVYYPVELLTQPPLTATQVQVQWLLEGMPDPDECESEEGSEE
ncbi:hypothetical protein ACIQC7_08835 [Kitasatospora sp. NPDC088556]|uniref:hypothetical protein n=1 Tax=Kitasatospora sp. NPDC088556 TaxID=3364076 RepID=UPI0037F95BA8